MVGSIVENSDSKLQFFQGLISLVNSSVGKELDNTESGSIAFMVERKHQGEVEPEVFLQETLGVGKDVSGRDAALQIHNRVFKEKFSRIHELMDTNPSDLEKLNAWKEQINIGHITTLDNYSKNPDYIPYIGGVSLDWIPAWFRSSNFPLGQER